MSTYTLKTYLKFKSKYPQEFILKNMLPLLRKTIEKNIHDHFNMAN